MATYGGQFTLTFVREEREAMDVVLQALDGETMS